MSDREDIDDASSELAESLLEADEEDARGQQAANQNVEGDSMLLDLPPGMYEGIHPVSYHVRALGFVSKHALDRIIAPKTPAHYHAWVTGLIPDEDTDAKFFGRAFHCASLERDRYLKEFAIMPDFGELRANARKGVTKEHGKRNKEARDAWRAEHRGRIHLSRTEGVKCDEMSASLRRHPEIAKLLDRGTFEVTLRFDDEESGLPCKARPDWLATTYGALLDLKSAEDASIEAFERDAGKYAYHRQAAFYIDAMDAIGWPINDFVFGVVEKNPPYAAALYRLEPESGAAGREDNRIGMDRLAECCARNEWPGYPTGVQTASLPRWKMRNFRGND